MMRRSVATIAVMCSFAAGLLAHLLYQRWNPAVPESILTSAANQQTPSTSAGEGQSFRVNFVPLLFRVAHSAKSNTYFLNFGPSREALTAVIFASTVELFEKNRVAPKNFENKEVELTGQIKDHPQYGLELILEDPKQIKILD
jgi:hypothetical protein